MSNLIRTIFSALRRWDDSKQRAPESGTEGDSPYVGSPLPRHRISLTATASFGFSGIPEEIRIRDINEKGLYFYTNLDMPVGANLDIVVVLPPEISADGQGRRVHYEAKVARVEREQGKEQYGVGASIRRCETFPLPTNTRPNKPAVAPTRPPAPTPKSAQQSRSIQGNNQPAPKTLAPLHIPKAAEPMPILPKTTAPVTIPRIDVTIKEAPAPVPVQKTTAPVEKTVAPVEKTVAPLTEIIASGVVDDTAAPNRPVTNQSRRAIVEKLATAGLRAGLTLEELVRLIDSGVTPTELVDIIEARLTVRIE